MARASTWFKRITLTVLILVGAVVALAFGALMYFHIPQNASGMAAKSICSARFVAGRPAAELMAEDVYGASGVLKLITVDIREDSRTVNAKFLGLFPRRASLLANRGCVLDETPDGDAKTYKAKPAPAQWPAGDSPARKRQWPDGVDAPALTAAVDSAFQGAGDPAAANARGVAVVQDGKLLVARYAPGFAEGTPLHGWSMTKTMAAMLAMKVFADKGLGWDTYVVDAFPKDREPAWVGQWRADERKQIRLSDLLFMRDGLDNSESYDPWGNVVQMLYGEPNMAAWAAEHKAVAPAGTRWMYLSATSVILADVVRAQFDDDPEYWDYPYKALLKPIGANSATLETDTSGTWVASSYLWADLSDWARLGQLTLQDGQWQGKQVLPKGWLELASTPAMPDGEGHGYGAQTWLLGDPVAGKCKGTGVPADTVAMEGHWGQVVAVVPSRRAVIVRLGWTFDKTQFNSCKFVADVLDSLAD